MNKYDHLNKKLTKAAVAGKLRDVCQQIEKGDDAEEIKLLDVLMHPEDRPPVIKTAACSYNGSEEQPCQVACLFEAIKRDENNQIIINKNKCTGCGECIEACPEQALVGRKDSLAVLHLLRDKSAPTYAMIAPAFTGQFDESVTAGKLRSAFKNMGFYGMIEVALFADVLTFKEALEFDREVQSDSDFLLTSCCCPLWVASIRKLYQTMIPHVPPSVSPMIACGRSIKKIHPEARTVFIGPCMAKKAEAREADIADAVDYVLTFEEIAELFTLMNINPNHCEEDKSDHSSRAGRLYARTAGVSEAVQATLDRIRPDKKIKLRAEQADGMIACKKLLQEISEGNIQANFIEGMGCRGGCVGGPKSLIDKDAATIAVNEYADRTDIKTPADNPFVLELLKVLGYETVESLLNRDTNFTRIL